MYTTQHIHLDAGSTIEASPHETLVIVIRDPDPGGTYLYLHLADPLTAHRLEAVARAVREAAAEMRKERIATLERIEALA